MNYLSHNAALPDLVQQAAEGNMSKEMVNHPDHYGGEDNPYEAIKVIEAWGLGFNTGNCIKYIARAKHKGKELEDLRKSLWYLNREIYLLEQADANSSR